jgi:hypothetical protein
MFDAPVIVLEKIDQQLDQAALEIVHTQLPIHNLLIFLSKETVWSIIDGVAKIPPYGVTVFFQDLDILYVCLRP